MTPDEIKQAVAEDFDIHVRCMLNRDRRAKVNVPRQVAMYLCRTLAGLKDEHIAPHFLRERSNICYAVNVVRDEIDVNEIMRARVDRIAEKLRARKAA